MQRADNGPIFVKNESGLAIILMSVSARLEVDKSKTFHISVRKPSILTDFRMFFGHQRADNGQIFLKNESGLAPAPVSVKARLQVDWSKTFHISVGKPQFWPICVCFLATRGPIMGRCSSKTNQVWP